LLSPNTAASTKDRIKKELHGADPYTHLRVSNHPTFHHTGCVLFHPLISFFPPPLTASCHPTVHGISFLFLQIPILAGDDKMRGIHDELVENRESSRPSLKCHIPTCHNLLWNLAVQCGEVQLQQSTTLAYRLVISSSLSLPHAVTANLKESDLFKVYQTCDLAVLAPPLPAHARWQSHPERSVVVADIPNSHSQNPQSTAPNH